jgi:hypothetical protein
LLCIDGQGIISGDKSSTGFKGYIGVKGPSINTEQGKISGVKGLTRNIGSIGDKGPFINTE